MTDRDDSSDPGYDGREVTTRTMALRAAGKRGDCEALADEIERMKRHNANRSGRETAWRVVGGIVTSAALALGGWALTQSQTAAVDHEHIGQHTEQLRSVATKLDEHGEQIDDVRRDAAVAATTQASLRQAVTDLTAEVRGLRDDLAERRGR
jgi:septal ring factor EnvC (AmiA/AmiB activator)